MSHFSSADRHDRYGYQRFDGVTTRSFEHEDKSLKSGKQNHIKKAEHVYSFAASNSQDDFEMSEIRSRKKLPRSIREEPKDECVEHFNREITEDDTLRSLSLQYACSISELKRVNNLIRDQDFYALRVVKIPMKQHGILSELVKEQEKKTSLKTKERLNNCITESLPNDIESCDTDLDDPETQQLVIRTLSIRDTLTSSHEAEEFLKNMDTDLNKICSSTRTKHDSLDEVISVLTNRSIRPIAKKKSSMFSGVDCGIGWWSIIIVVLVICIVLPAAYFIYVNIKS